jgi:hypothetical protein
MSLLDVSMSARDDREREPVLAQAIARDLDVRDVVRHPRELDLRDEGMREQLVARALGELAQRPDIDRAEEPDAQDLDLARDAG